MAVAQPQLYCLRWNNHQHNLLSVFEDLLNHEAFVDVTLSCDGLNLKAHKMVLSACSPYFQSMFYNTPDKHPVVFLKDVRYEEMKALLEFMYRGEVSVDQQHLSSLLKVAESLKIKGLADVNESHAANLSSVSHHNPHHPHHHLPPLPLTTGGQHVSAPPPTLIPSFMSSTGGASPLLSPSQLPPSSKRSQTDSSPHSSSAFLGSKRKRGRPRRLSGSDAGPTSAISLCEERMDEGGINSSPIPDNSLTEHAQSPVKSRQEGNDAVSLSPTDLKTSDIPSEAESNDGRSSGLLNSHLNGNGKDNIDQVLDLQTRKNSGSDKSSPPPQPLTGPGNNLVADYLLEPDNICSSPLPLVIKPSTEIQLPPPLTPPTSTYTSGKAGKSPGKRNGSPGKPGRPPGSGRSPGRSPSGTRGNLASQPGTESESLQDMSVRGLDLLKYAQMSNDGSYRCLECEKMQLDKSFKNKYSFQRHAFLYHEGQQRKVFPCPVCQKEFSRPDKMKQHLKQVHDCIIPKTDSGAATASLASTSHFMIPPFLAGLEDPTANTVEAKLQTESTGSEMFKLMSRLVGHTTHTSPGSGSGKAS